MTEDDIRYGRRVCRWCPVCVRDTTQRPPIWSQKGTPWAYCECLECGTQLYRCFDCGDYTVPGVDTHAQGPGCHCPPAVPAVSARPLLRAVAAG